MKKTLKGFTLMEILVSLLILSIGIVGILLFLSRSMSAIDFANDSIVASSHGEYILEEMRTRDSLANIISTNWENFALEENLDTLPSESINIYFPTPANDPLEIQATIEWTRNSRQNNIILTTEMTKW